MKKIIKVSIAIAFSLFVSTSAFAESSLNLINKASLAGARSWTDVLVSKGGDVMAGVDFIGDLYLSNDAGASWRKSKHFDKMLSAISSSADSKYMVVASDYIYVSNDYGQTWNKSNSGSGGWVGLASTPDGNIVVAATGGRINNDVINKKISISYDKGNNWTELQNSPSKRWFSVDISADGNTIVAISQESDYIYVSKDRGNTWVQKSDKRTWRSVSVSGDGKKIFASVLSAVDYVVDNPTSGISRLTFFPVSSPGYLYKSDDSGDSWKEIRNNGVQDWREVAVSQDGNVVIAGTVNNGVFLSVDGGNNFYNKNLGSINNVAVSSDGKTFVVANMDVGFIYTSNNSGNDWALKLIGSNMSWSSASISKDGSKIVATPSYGYMYMSTDYGRKWKILTDGGLRYWSSVSMSDDGSKIFASYISDDNNSKGGLVISQDGGLSFNVSQLNDYFASISTSGDGRTVIISSGLSSNNDPSKYGYVYKSTNSGLSWSSVNSLGKEPWKMVRVSNDGKLMVAVRHTNAHDDSFSDDGARFCIERRWV